MVNILYAPQLVISLPFKVLALKRGSKFATTRSQTQLVCYQSGISLGCVTCSLFSIIQQFTVINQHKL